MNTFGIYMYGNTSSWHKFIFLCLQVLGLYKGMASPLYGLAAINAIVFGVQGNIQRRLQNPDSLTSHFLAGSVAGFAQTVICSPMELAKTRLQIQGQGESRQYFSSHAHSYEGPVDCLRKIYRVEGFRGVFRGFGLTAWRETPSFGVYFAVYEGLCQQFSNDKDETSTIVFLMAGGFAGMASWLSTYPVDVIKSRIQADMRGEYKGFWDCCVKSYHQEGFAVFGKGIGSTMLRAFPVNAATFGAVEMVLKYARADEKEDGTYKLSSIVQEQQSQTSAVDQQTSAKRIEPHVSILPTVPSLPSQT